MKKMTTTQFHEAVMLYLIDIAKTYDFSEPDTVIFSPEFDNFIRHIKSRPLGKLKTFYIREDSITKLLFRQLKTKIERDDDIKIL